MHTFMHANMMNEYIGKQSSWNKQYAPDLEILRHYYQKDRKIFVLTHIDFLGSRNFNRMLRTNMARNCSKYVFFLIMLEIE